MCCHYCTMALISRREKVIKRAHKEVGHMATGKTLSRLREAYVWPGI